MSTMFIYVVADGKISFFLKTEWYFTILNPSILFHFFIV